MEEPGRKIEIHIYKLNIRESLSQNVKEQSSKTKLFKNFIACSTNNGKLIL